MLKSDRWIRKMAREHDMIKQTFRENVADTPALATLIAELKAANLALWTIEDLIRDRIGWCARNGWCHFDVALR